MQSSNTHARADAPLTHTLSALAYRECPFSRESFKESAHTSFPWQTTFAVCVRPQIPALFEIKIHWHRRSSSSSSSSRLSALCFVSTRARCWCCHAHAQTFLPLRLILLQSLGCCSVLYLNLGEWKSNSRGTQTAFSYSCYSKSLHVFLST